MILTLEDRGEQHAMRRFTGDGHWWHLNLRTWREMGEPSHIVVNVLPAAWPTGSASGEGET